MAIFTDIETHVGALRGMVGADAEPAALPGIVSRLSDDDVVALLTSTAGLIRAAQAVQVVASGVAAARSTRDAGHSGLAQGRGQGSVTSLLQDLTGATRSDAVKQVRAGEALLEGLAGPNAAGGGRDDGSGAGGSGAGGSGAGGSGADGSGTDGGGAEGDARDVGGTYVRRPWHAPLGDALLYGRISSCQHDAIRRGLGEPPEIDAAAILACAASAAGQDGSTGGDGTVDGDSTVSGDGVVGDGAVGGDAAGGDAAGGDATALGTGAGPASAAGLDADALEALLAAARDEARQAWESAASQLVDEAACRTVEDLGAQARTIRDLLDPEGAQRRFEQRYQRRSFRTWRDRDGITHGSFLFDDDGALWVTTILDAALAPRRGVRFVDDTEKQRAKALVDDPRTTDQLAYDLAIDLLRTGALADAETVFGTRQAGVRIITTQDALHAADHGEPAVASVQDDTATLPAWLAAQHACNTGARECLFDSAGNPLDLGREARLYTPKQKLALAVRDGGCRWPGCDRPAHYCEAHHIDPWAGGGTTDIDRGILLCRFHHGHLHHAGWRITRHGKNDFTLHPPGDDAPITLTTRLARQYLFRTAAPPPRSRPTAA